MSDTSKDTVPDNLAGMLPVGMINGGGTAAAAMAQSRSVSAVCRAGRPFITSGFHRQNLK
jgi:hypothetical protein